MIASGLALEVEPQPKWAGHKTARKAVDLLVAKEMGFHNPTKVERDALLVGFAMKRKVLYGAAYDAVRLEAAIDLTDPQSIADNVSAITLCEIKSTSREAVGADLNGYFFNITAAELLTAQSLGKRYRFVFVNTLDGSHAEMSLAEVFARARGMYPAWHIRF